VPIFQGQIARGGPVTVTHPDMKRYFMTIPEAVQLVLLASAIGSNGDVLVLDMGDPVRILDVAKQMIEHSGRDIEIVFTGMRPGEKLYEELVSGAELMPTQHVGILRAREAFTPWEVFEHRLQQFALRTQVFFHLHPLGQSGWAKVRALRVAKKNHDHSPFEICQRALLAKLIG
jgi:FlaA1/EpsC-like NDP-sugar epimerase